MRFFLLVLSISTIFLLNGCGNNDAQKTKKEEPKVKTESIVTNEKSGQVDYDALRKKANVAEAASAVGYDGKAIKKELNKVIDANEKMQKQMNDIDL